MNRRDFFKAGAAAGLAVSLEAFPPSIRRALALPASSPTGTLADVQHVVILMQENRSFDHYFGTLGGVRGFGDRQTAPLRNARSVWEQPDGHGGVVPPFHMSSKHTAAQHVRSLPHGWADGHAAWAGGRYDNWVPAKSSLTMGHYTREDIPWHFALADAFTICDAYFCSLPGATNPNRSHLMTGTIDPFGAYGGPMKDQPAEGPDFQPRNGPPFSYATYPERLEAAGVSWRVYQGVDADGPFPVDVQDAIRRRHDPHPEDVNASVSCFNVLRFFGQYAHAPEDSPLYQKAMTRRPPSQFAADAMAGKLPQVSWVMPPHNCSEHPQWTPADGAAFISFVLDALTANPDTWSKTVLLVMYDENDGYFDHVVPPTPPAGPAQGATNVDVSADIHAADGLPFGLGARVPLLAVSPWSKGGAVCSQVFDHTSVIRFLEQRFGVHEPNISPWRRAVCGDLTAAFDFAYPDGRVPPLPDTRTLVAAALAQADLPAPRAPAMRGSSSVSLHRQEPTQRVARALPYRLHVWASVADGDDALTLHFVNSGRVAAVFHVFDGGGEANPQCYTVAAGTKLAGTWPLGRDASYDVRVLGPNGFVRGFGGSRNAASPAHGLDVRLDYQVNDGANSGANDGTASADLRLAFINDGARDALLVVTDNAYGAAPRTWRVRAKGRVEADWPLSASDAWYDLTVSAPDHPDFCRSFAGHVETGRPGRTDPALGRTRA
ncbi:phosphocholine-specific phospholipase C [Paraburkholderia kururiensis]|uniref:phosphocholine-specific phospholipase C n=1 Tax=Paraburkholderia kururiensis TaxID=984307 RepID=UPI0005A61189|nr:phospholipase C, phosphocholine-specific [Paraburkholderia kururiensis]